MESHRRVSVSRQTLDEANTEGLKLLHKALREENAVLIAGAGASIDAGYPSWDDLVANMARELVPGFSMVSTEPTRRIQEICNESWRITGNNNAFAAYIAKTFAPNERTYTDLHRQLMRLPFAGLATTNFDEVLEAAVYGELKTPARVINLCKRDDREILMYRRDLTSQGRARETVLHLHGSYLCPKDIVLTTDDYERFYNGRPPRDQINGAAMIKRSTHASTLRFLLEPHVVVFVGFSMTDEPFTRVMRALCEEYGIQGEAIHVAFTECRDEKHMGDIVADWRNYGVAPIFYPLPDRSSGDHSALTRIIAALAEEFGLPRLDQPSLAEVSERMLRYF